MRILLCSHKKERYLRIRAMLNEVGISELILAENMDEVYRELQLVTYDAIIIDLPFTCDQYELSFVMNLYEKFECINILLMVNEIYIVKIRDRIERFGIFTIQKPLSVSLFLQIIYFMKAAGNRVKSLRNDQKKLVKKIDEIKKVDRAKCLLIENEDMSEATAHHTIEKQAMDERVSRLEIAEKLIVKYES